MTITRAAQILGAVTFTKNPSEMTIIRPERSCSHVLTYGGAAFFSWGTSVAGKVVELKWNSMPTGQYEDIQELVEADAEVVFNPQDGEGKTYDVEILGLAGEYLIGISESDSPSIRKNVVLTLLILSSDTIPE